MEHAVREQLALSGTEAAYDANAKALLGEKIVLAHILAGCIEEYRGRKPEELLQYIEGEPFIGTVPVNPGETNSPHIQGMNQESKIPYEGMITYDVHFFARLPEENGLAKIIVDVEAQKNSNPGYDPATRGTFYCARMLSAQLHTEFEAPSYGEIKKVYSIWICMNAPKGMEHTAVEHRMVPRDLVGHPVRYGKSDLLSVIEINLSKTLAGKDEELKLHRFLGTLFSGTMEMEEKIDILQREYGMKLEEDIGRRLNTMCNLSEALVEEGMERGREEGRAEGRIQGMIEALKEMGIPLETILKKVEEKFGLSEEDVKKYL